MQLYGLIHWAAVASSMAAVCESESSSCNKEDRMMTENIGPRWPRPWLQCANQSRRPVKQSTGHTHTTQTTKTKTTQNSKTAKHSHTHKTQTLNDERQRLSSCCQSRRRRPQDRRWRFRRWRFKEEKMITENIVLCTVACAQGATLGMHKLC